MSPRPDRQKYQGRNAEIGRQEADRRLNSLPTLERRSANFSEELGFQQPMLLPKGSAAVNMCTAKSDFDVAVVVQSGHVFTQKPKLWRQYQEALSKTNADYKIEPRLVVESPFQTRGRLFKLISARSENDLFTQDMLDKLKRLLPKNE